VLEPASTSGLGHDADSSAAPLASSMGTRQVRLLLLNPNTNTATTEAMVAIAEEEAHRRGQSSSPPTIVEGMTSARGAPLILNEDMLRAAAAGVVGELRALHSAGTCHFDGIIVGAFGDPGLEEGREFCSCPLTGLGEASIAEAAAGQRRFAVATTTPLLAGSIERRVEALGALRE
jgi:allantoin racemase